MGKTPLQQPCDVRVSTGTPRDIFSATVQERCSLPGKKKKEQKSDQTWKGLKGCSLLIQRSEGTRAK